jgi:Fic-DOC domain mobile mystery protein B
MSDVNSGITPGQTALEDFDGLKIKSVRTRAQLNAVEAINIAKAVAKYLEGPLNQRIAPFSYSSVMRVHREMFGDVWKWAGTTRKKDANIGCHWYQIDEQLKHLLEDLKSWTGFKWPLEEQAAVLHYRAVKIHPFKNGNGRWSRMLANIWLRLNDEPCIMWPNDLIDEQSTIRNEYLTALQAADQGDFSCVQLRSLQARFTGPIQSSP